MEEDSRQHSLLLAADVAAWACLIIVWPKPIAVILFGAALIVSHRFALRLKNGLEHCVGNRPA